MVGECKFTNDSSTLTSNRQLDWYSSEEKNYPYIQYSIKNKLMKITKYSVRNECCDCNYCLPSIKVVHNNSKYICKIYRYSLVASNDNKTWQTLHKVDGDQTFDMCDSKTFSLPKQYNAYKYVRFRLDGTHPGYMKAMQIN